jgi:hypothetical protein
VLLIRARTARADWGALIDYAVLAAGALHPSARDVAAQAERPGASVRPLVLGLLAAASLIAPGILALQVLSGEVTDGLAIASARRPPRARCSPPASRRGPRPRPWTS